jgi:amino acid transporter
MLNIEAAAPMGPRSDRRAIGRVARIPRTPPLSFMQGDPQVTTEITDADSQLRRNSLGLPELVFQGVTHIAPATNIVFTFPIIALKAGPDMPLSFLLSTIVCLLIGNTVSQFSRYMPSSGGYYSFATRGLGSRAGFMATWSYLIYEILGSAGCTGFLGYLISDMLQMQFQVKIPWWSFALATSVLIWALTHHGVQLSARITAFLGGLELLIMLVLGITFLIHPGPGSTYFAPLKPSSSPHHFVGIFAGMVFSILALSGFEAPAPLAQEARLPGKLIGQAIMLSLVSIGVFYIFTSYASAIGWGTGDMAAFASNPNPYMRREQRAKFTIWRHVLVPWIATLALLPVLFVTVYPVPSWPYNITPYLFLLTLLVGFAYMQWREWRNPGALGQGAMMLIRGANATEGDPER